MHKICLVKVFPAGHPDKAMKLYAVLDEQSNRSLVCSEFFKMFDEHASSSPYSQRTYAGIKETMGRRASGDVIKSLDRTVQLSLPSLTECNNILNIIVFYHSYLQTVAHIITDMTRRLPQ